MSPKKKSEPIPTKISVNGGVKGIGNVVGDQSQSNVNINPLDPKEGLPKGRANSHSLWVKVGAFLITLFGTFAVIGAFARLLAGFNSLLVIQVILAGLVTALGVSGFLRPELFIELFGKLFGKK